MNLSAIEHNNNTQQRRQVYVPARVKVIEVTAQKVICTSGDGTETPGLSPDNNPYSF